MKFLDPKKLHEAVVQVRDLAKQEREVPVVVGGYAMQAYGSDRLTGDLDLAVTKDLCLFRHEGRLTYGGFISRAPNKVPVDFIVRSDGYAPLYEDAIKHAKRVAGVPLPVATPEYMVAMKMAAGRSKDEQDVEFLLLADKVNLDEAYEIIKKHLGLYAAEEFRSTVDLVDWQKSRKNPARTRRRR